MKKRKWNPDDLSPAVASSRSLREVIIRLRLIPAGGNYQTVQRMIIEQGLDTSHFLGKGWNVGLKFVPVKRTPLKQLLKKGSFVQTFKLKRRLFFEGLKSEHCELCGWASRSEDGRIPLELDHKNGDRNDNRLTNLRILCPNCHSLQPTHRGRNIRSRKK